MIGLLAAADNLGSSRLLRFARNDEKYCLCEERSDDAISPGTKASRPVWRRASTVFLLLLVAVVLAGCGKKGPPQPPPNEPNTYPRTYPSA
jgi:predicted small lipoprotein YifL